MAATCADLVRTRERTTADRRSPKLRAIGHSVDVSEHHAPTFEQWLYDITFDPELPANRQGDLSDEWRRWLRHLFEHEGPMSKADVDRAAMAHQVALANGAVTAVMADLHRTTAFRPIVEVDVWESCIRISIDGGST